MNIHRMLTSPHRLFAVKTFNDEVRKLRAPLIALSTSGLTHRALFTTTSRHTDVHTTTHGLHQRPRSPALIFIGLKSCQLRLQPASLRLPSVTNQPRAALTRLPPSLQASSHQLQHESRLLQLNCHRLQLAPVIVRHGINGRLRNV